MFFLKANYTHLSEMNEANAGSYKQTNISMLRLRAGTNRRTLDGVQVRSHTFSGLLLIPTHVNLLKYWSAVLSGGAK